MRIVVIDGHPDAGSYGDAVARSYVAGAEGAGHEVRLFRLRAMKFDLVLHGGFKKPQPLEADLVAARDAIRWCQHLVIVTPCWWWHVPALLKGFIDRVFLPGVGVEYVKRFPYIRKLLTGRSARVIYTQNSPQWLAVLAREDLFWRNMRRAFLGHCGFHPIRRTRLDEVNDISQAERADFLNRVKRLGQRGR